MSSLQKWILFIGVFAVGWILWLLAPILTPFLVSALLAYMADPIVDRLELKKIPRTLAVIIVFFVMLFGLLLLLVILIPRIESQLFILLQKLPSYYDWLHNHLTSLFEVQNETSPLSTDSSDIQKVLMDHIKNAGGIASWILGSIAKSSFALINFMVNCLLIPVVTFYLLRDWDILVEKCKTMLPITSKSTVLMLANQSDKVLAEFMRGQIMVMFSLGVIYTTGLWLCGIEMALLIGMMAGLVSFVPYLGFIVGLLVAGIVTLIQFHDISHLIPVIAVFGVGQLLEGMILTPYFVGEKIGLHPVAVIFSVMAGGQLYGFFGILLALPVAAVIVVLLRYFHQQYMNCTVITGKLR
ncbi:MAG: AI-2E family transporter [Methylococcales bacterium]|jgi:predicted PurR-regulated permease PerM|nr:AI-2E family transporter [Methylococcales bacterium]MBT7411055.1 AI-2E family transporter [Methylococcales bacterium]